MAEQQQTAPLLVHVGLDKFGDPLCTLELPGGERTTLTPEGLQGIASYLMAAAAHANTSAAMFRSLIGEGTAPDVAAAYVAKIMG